jgi:hypothetical protein
MKFHDGLRAFEVMLLGLKREGTFDSGQLIVGHLPLVCAGLREDSLGGGGR